MVIEVGTDHLAPKDQLDYLDQKVIPVRQALQGRKEKRATAARQALKAILVLPVQLALRVIQVTKERRVRRGHRVWRVRRVIQVLRDLQVRKGHEAMSGRVVK
jgi:hypothetical protein